jgi:hypothetical protein
MRLVHVAAVWSASSRRAPAHISAPKRQSESQSQPEVLRSKRLLRVLRLKGSPSGS